MQLSSSDDWRQPCEQDHEDQDRRRDGGNGSSIRVYRSHYRNIRVGVVAIRRSGPEHPKFGTREDLVDGAGTIVQGWTVHNLEPSTDVIPYPVRGRLWEAYATDEAIRGSVTPIISDMNARAPGGETYRAIFNVPSPTGSTHLPWLRGKRPVASCISTSPAKTSTEWCTTTWFKTY